MVNTIFKHCILGELIIMKRFLTIVAFTLTIITLFTACNNEAISYEVDGTGENVTQDYPVIIDEQTISSEPQNVAVLSGSIADVIISMGLQNQVAIVSTDCTQTEYEELTKIEATDVSSLINAGIDLVIGRDISNEMLISLSTAGIATINVDNATNRVDFEILYTTVGTALKGANTGYNLGLSTAQTIFTSLDDVARIIPTSTSLVTMACIIDLESKAVTGDVVQSTSMGYAGVTNVFSSLTDMTYTLETLTISDPDVILCPEGLKDELMSNSSFSELTAVINDEVYEVPIEYFYFEGSNLVLFTTYVAGVAYPELLEEQDQTVELPSSYLDDADEDTDDSVDTDEDTDDSELENDDTTEDDTLTNSVVLTDDGYDLENSEYSELTTGDISYDVYKLEARLYELGYLASSPTDTYTTVTEEAVIAFQNAIEVEETGTADVYTLERLYADDAPIFE